MKNNDKEDIYFNVELKVKDFTILNKFIDELNSLNFVLKVERVSKWEFYYKEV